MPPPSRKVVFALSSVLNLTRYSLPVRYFSTMGDTSGTQTPTGSGPDKKAKAGNKAAKKDVKILMLHGKATIYLFVLTRKICMDTAP